MKKNKGFSLIEMLLAIAIVGVLAGAVMVSLSGQKDKANTTKVVGELSSVIHSIVMCKADSYSVNSLSSGGRLCGSYDGYGSWPILPSGFSYSGSVGTSADWSFSVTKSGSIVVCCNAKNMSCFEKNSCSTATVP